MIVDAAIVDCEYIEVAYRGFPPDGCDIDWACLASGILACRRILGSDGLCRDRSNRPERFSLSEACIIGGDSVLDRNVVVF